MAQLSYSINLSPVSYPGQPADSAVLTDIVSVTNAAAAIPYGVLVVRDTAHGNPGAWEITGKVPSLTTDITNVGSALGVAMADQARPQDPSVSVPTFPINSVVPCMATGRIWVAVDSAVVAGAQAFVRFGSSVNGTQLGAFRADADTVSSTDHAVALPGATFVTSQASAGGYAVVQLSIH